MADRFPGSSCAGRASTLQAAEQLIMQLGNPEISSRCIKCPQTTPLRCCLLLVGLRGTLIAGSCFEINICLPPRRRVISSSQVFGVFFCQDQTALLSTAREPAEPSAARKPYFLRETYFRTRCSAIPVQTTPHTHASQQVRMRCHVCT